MKRDFKRAPAGVTLVELILATLLMSVVILTGLSMEIAIRRLYLVADQEAQLMGEAGAIMTFVTKRIHQAPGDWWNNPLMNWTNATAVRYGIKRDDNNNGLWDATDGWEVFTFFTSGTAANQLWYGINSSLTVMMSDHVVNFTVVNPIYLGGDGCSRIWLTLRRDPLNAVNATNPQILINSSAQYRGMSLNQGA